MTVAGCGNSSDPGPQPSVTPGSSTLAPTPTQPVSPATSTTTLPVTTTTTTAPSPAEELLATMTLQQKAAQEQEIAEVTTKAVKRYKRRGAPLLEASPEAQIVALDQYINDLRLVGQELELRYGPGIERRLWLINHEIDVSIEAISRLRIAQITPGK